MAHGGLEVFYDGDCPLCRNYVQMLRLRDALGPVDLIDARGDDPRLAALRRAGCDLNAGMVVRQGDLIWQGGDAVWMLSRLAGRGPMAWLLRDRRRAARLYPWLRAGRGLLLRLLGRRPIG
ncbi:DCC1-like thiol-disulfide oxidoreductase family protein [Paracoccus sp. S3-43]|uniref:DCC1-like thiol-disulfide oxidoreductase family protein n=1 Tax=Paracoccus sp. S3-43 TaxID=3030011 RepID=UPI0023AFD893|nr:DCC1-like thiol-disulfide oxidoreductase family protein [Paracoccus sp. S3-43]WEF25698.1 DCC1-like thiol-disulfide oxidoreductase family protein [Paracoccus sp. S3-43]